MLQMLSASRLVAAIAALGRVSARRNEAQRAQDLENYYSAILADVSDLVTIVDRNGVRRFVSSSYRRVLGYNSADLVGRGILDFVHPDDLPEAKAHLGNDRFFGIKRDLKLRVRHADGSWRLLNVTARSRFEDPAVRGIVVTARDETALRHAELNLLQAQKLGVVGRCATAIAHDSNNLLTVVIGNLALALDGTLQPDDRELIVDAQDAAQRTAKLNRQLLGFSRSRPFRPELLHINHVVSSMQRLIARLIGAHIELQIRLEPALWEVVADGAQVEQAVLNLVVNARDAMPDDGVLVLASKNIAIEEEQTLATGSMRPGRYVCIEVSDNGSGIDPKIAARIFEPFFTTKESTKGTGIGLATVAGIMKQIDGYVAVNSTPGGGSSFLLYFPAEPPAERPR